MVLTAMKNQITGGYFRWRVILFVILALIISPQSVFAKDLDLLIRYLIPVFLSQNFALICRANNPYFLSDLPNGTTLVDDFSNEMKREITDRLSADDLQLVVITAANNARATARNALIKISPEYPKLAAVPTERWCNDDARSFILRVIKTDQAEHEHFLKIIEAAKR